MYPNYMSFNPSHSSEPRNEDPVQADRHLVPIAGHPSFPPSHYTERLNDDHGATNFAGGQPVASRYSQQSPMRPSTYYSHDSVLPSLQFSYPSLGSNDDGSYSMEPRNDGYGATNFAVGQVAPQYSQQPPMNFVCFALLFAGMFKH